MASRYNRVEGDDSFRVPIKPEMANWISPASMAHSNNQFLACKSRVLCPVGVNKSCIFAVICFAVDKSAVFKQALRAGSRVRSSSFCASVNAGGRVDIICYMSIRRLDEINRARRIIAKRPDGVLSLDGMNRVNVKN